jgi:hypothetical protein
MKQGAPDRGCAIKRKSAGQQVTQPCHFHRMIETGNHPMMAEAGKHRHVRMQEQRLYDPGKILTYIISIRLSALLRSGEVQTAKFQDHIHEYETGDAGYGIKDQGTRAIKSQGGRQQNIFKDEGQDYPVKRKSKTDMFFYPEMFFGIVPETQVKKFFQDETGQEFDAGGDHKIDKSFYKDGTVAKMGGGYKKQNGACSVDGKIGTP